jgi:3'-phosphoadenosine 5'-phosphosulfate sulfotransferase (PAPS reductase)/FAD synthetase
VRTPAIGPGLLSGYPNSAILSVTGIRQSESAQRAKAPISCVEDGLTSKTLRTTGMVWSAIADWTLQDIFAFLADRKQALHEAYPVQQTLGG